MQIPFWENCGANFEMLSFRNNNTAKIYAERRGLRYRPSADSSLVKKLEGMYEESVSFWGLSDLIDTDCFLCFKSWRKTHTTDGTESTSAKHMMTLFKTSQPISIDYPVSDSSDPIFNQIQNLVSDDIEIHGHKKEVLVIFKKIDTDDIKESHLDYIHDMTLQIQKILAVPSVH